MRTVARCDGDGEFERETWLEGAEGRGSGSCGDGHGDWSFRLIKPELEINEAAAETAAVAAAKPAKEEGDYFRGVGRSGTFEKKKAVGEEAGRGAGRTGEAERRSGGAGAGGGGDGTEIGSPGEPELAGGEGGASAEAVEACGRLGEHFPIDFAAGPVFRGDGEGMAD